MQPSSLVQTLPGAPSPPLGPPPFLSGDPHLPTADSEATVGHPPRGQHPEVAEPAYPRFPR